MCIEAMACGAALVTTDNGGSRDYAFDGTTALVADVGDAARLTEHVVTLLRDDALRVRDRHRGPGVRPAVPVGPQRRAARGVPRALRGGPRGVRSPASGVADAARYPPAGDGPRRADAAMRVSFIFPSSHFFSGGTTMFFEFANVLARRGHEVHFIHAPGVAAPGGPGGGHPVPVRPAGRAPHRRHPRRPVAAGGRRAVRARPGAARPQDRDRAGVPPHRCGMGRAGLPRARPEDLRGDVARRRRSLRTASTSSS